MRTLGIVLLCGLASCTAESSKAAPADPETPVANEPKVETPAAPETKMNPLDYNLSAEAAAKLLEENPDVVVLDVRTPPEFAEGHFKDAINVDYKAPDFKEQAAKLDTETTYLLHCRSGRRSTAAYGILLDLGFKNVYHLEKGALGWEAAGYKLEK